MQQFTGSLSTTALAILMSVISCFIYSARRRRALALYQMQRQNYANQVQHNNVYRNPGYDVNQPQGWMGPPPAGPPPPGYTPAPYPGQQAYYPDGAAPPPNPPEYGKTGYDGFPMPTGQPFGTQTPGSPGQGASYQPPAGPPPAHLHP
ncbi:hypothetical protein VNI00_009541 [Paramarasmius palmivorus]|uniref:Uncharacterized protein n=1 Tax=Paramarasmius palmivorus TaxID=297713 RepID=A0AAW0CQ02_9AGAR